MARDDRKNSNRYTIWQWNCRGYRRKRGNLQQFIDSKSAGGVPDVIALQETGGQAKLSGYTSYFDEEHSDDKRTPVTTLVRRNVPAMRRETGIGTVDHVLVEIISAQKRGQGSVFVLNVYSSPQKRHRFKKLFRKVLDIAGKQPLVIVGDFNAPHPAWGYKKDLIKGRNLWLDCQQEALTLVTDPGCPTRTGNSVSVDTTPDLTFVRNVGEGTVRWTNLKENLGSDHFIVATDFVAGPTKAGCGTQLRLVDWDSFRLRRRCETADGNEESVGATRDITDLRAWVTQLHGDVKASTKTIPEEAGLEQTDARLLHMWEAKEGLQRRLAKQKYNRSLRRRLARLNKEIEDYANHLAQQTWHNRCDEMDRQMGLAKTWNTLRYLIDPQMSKTTQKQNLSKIIHKFEGSDEELVREIRNRYVGNDPRVKLKDYEGPSNPKLDEPITLTEVRGAIQALRTKSAPGPDGVTNKMLRNLDDDSIEALTRYLNWCWERGEIPAQWKDAKIVMIPKPGKKLHLENLRPISLTSCMGKLLEHVVLNRLHALMDERGLFPHTMIGFRPGLSTQDVMLRLKHKILDGEGCSPLDTRAILGLDLTKAFDSVKHEAIMESLEGLGVGTRTYNYVRDFLSNRTARLVVGGVESDVIEIGSRGTPQGSVLSPFLFNAVMIGLPRILDSIEGLEHSLYADDITIWSSGGGSDGEIQERLQRAADAVVEYAAPKGLRCSPQKSELLLYNPRRQTKSAMEAAKRSPPIELWAEGLRIPVVHSIRVLGLRIQANGHNMEAIKALEGSVHQTTRLISRIANRHRGMKEENLLRLVQAFVVSRVVYVVPFLNMLTSEKEKVDRLMRRAYKQALGIPITTSTETFAAMGLHNSVDELIEAQRIAQAERLSRSRTGRHILASLGIRYESQFGEKHSLPIATRGVLKIPPLPANMHPQRDVARRAARAAALKRQLEPNAGTTNVNRIYYVDAADYQITRRSPIRYGAMAAAVADHEGNLVASGSVWTTSPEVGEEVAIALAIGAAVADGHLEDDTPVQLTLETATTSAPALSIGEKAVTARIDRVVIISDSKAAIRNFAKGRVSLEATKVLFSLSESTISRLNKNPITLLWAPAHSGLPGNERAHEAARALTIRARVCESACIGAHGDGRTKAPSSPTGSEGTGQADGGVNLPSNPWPSASGRLVTYREILDHYRSSRLKYPPADKILERGQAVAWRLLQANRYPNPALYNRCYPGMYDAHCKWCKEAKADLAHMLWACSGPTDNNRVSNDIAQADPPHSGKDDANTMVEQYKERQKILSSLGITGPLSWETALLSTDPQIQKKMIQLAEGAAGAHGLLAAT